jgi:hypothetical protein
MNKFVPYLIVFLLGLGLGWHLTTAINGGDSCQPDEDPDEVMTPAFYLQGS